jgi:hypothetical protein
MAITYRKNGLRVQQGLANPQTKKKFEVLAKEGDTVRLVRFGDVKGGPG